MQYYLLFIFRYQFLILLCIRCNLVNENIDPAFPLFDSGDIEGYDGKTVISSIYAAWAKKQGEDFGIEDLAAISEYDNPVLVFHTLNY